MDRLERDLRRACAVRDGLAGGIAGVAVVTGISAAVQETPISLVIFCGVVAPALAGWAVSVFAARALRRELFGEVQRLREVDSEEDARRQAAIAQRSAIREVLTAGDSLRIAFQPIVELATEQVVGHEALARFRDERGPDEWFARAHAAGMGVELEMLAVSRAVEARPDGGFVAVNVSPVTVTSQPFRDFLAERLSTTLVIEVTEHASIDDYDAVTDAIELVRARGGHFAVDDAGGGYASMLHIVSLAPDIIKIDQRLIASIDVDPARQELVRSLQRFAERTGALLCAEGIERPEELATCREIGVRLGQGYLLGPPSPLDEHRDVRSSSGPQAD